MGLCPAAHAPDRSLKANAGLFLAVMVFSGGLAMPTAAQSTQETVEEVFALVDGTPILRSDILLLQLVGLSGAIHDGESREQYLSRSLDMRIRLELQYRDLLASGSIHRLRIDVAEEIDALVARGNGRETLETALQTNGLGWEDLEALALRTSAARAWVDQHLRPRISVSIEDVENAYRNLVVEPHQKRGEEPPALAQVQGELHNIIIERELNRELERWLVQARDRLAVFRFRP